ncbi:MAG TPA: AAA family ATPase [Allosphingosinicella sp.]|jgi:SpoVK/Ycf46/Vps4 family AAA+-type ATPase
MGEKLLAQRILALLRDTIGPSSPEGAAALGWASDQRDWLWPGQAWADSAPGLIARALGVETLDWESLPRLLGRIDTAELEPPLFAGLRAAAALLELDRFDLDLIETVAAFERLPRLSALRFRLGSAGADVPALIGRLAGAPPSEATARIRGSEALALGLLWYGADAGMGGNELQLQWRFARLLDEGPADEARLVGALAGIPQSAALGRSDFVEHEESFDLIVRLLSGAIAARAAGVAVLLHGPPGTGKTELARAVAEAAGAALFAVGEADLEGEEPSRLERLQALKRSQRLLARRGGSVLLFDEMEDLFAEASWSAGGGRRSGSKIYVNRLLEEGAVPVIWTTNDVGAVDPAHLRRMSFVLRMDYPSPRARARIAARAARAEGVAGAEAGLAPFLLRDPESASVARAALRTAALSGGGAEAAAAAERSLILGLRGGRSLPPAPAGGGLDLALYEADVAIAPLMERLSKRGAPGDFSLLLTGPPGTGKTALATHLADRLDRPLKVKRASDLLSKWVGGTEANIAEAFAEARDEGAVLLFDEADSLLLDRSGAQRSWEITQVNEMLTWMDQHPLPFVAATNFARRLDPAALRRFVFKIELRALSAEAAARAFERFFGKPAPAGLAEVGGLTPGDFAVVKRQLRYRAGAGAGEILALLEAEAKAKPEQVAKIGF